MKKEENNLIEKQLKEKKKIPENVKQEINKNVFRNLFAAICVLLYFIFITLGYHNIASNAFITDTKIFSMCLIIVTVFLFEKSYNEGNTKLGVHGIETLIISIITLFMQYVYVYQKNNFISMYIAISIAFLVYYAAKSIVITVKTKKKYYNNISDVKDIVKKEKKKIEDEEILEDKEMIAEEETKKVKSNKKETKANTTDKKTKTTKKIKDSTTTRKTTKNEVITKTSRR